MDDLIGSLDKGIHEMKKRANMVNIFAYHLNIKTKAIIIYVHVKIFFTNLNSS